MMMRTIRLGVNVDHVATLRNARNEDYPDPVAAALVAARAGADNITAHLREDRRHIRDEDLFRLNKELKIPLNMEMAATDEMIAIAQKVKPHAVCLVPEKRQELTTEGGLDVCGHIEQLRDAVTTLLENGIRPSLFIDADPHQVSAAAEIGASVVELHTGDYAEAKGKQRHNRLSRIQEAAVLAEEQGLECHAGHGLTFDNVVEIASIPQVAELNIGHFLISQSVFMGLEAAVKHMKTLMINTRTQLYAA